MNENPGATDPREVDPVREWKFAVTFEATFSEADELYDRMMDALVDVFGAFGDSVDESPSLGFGSLHPIGGSRRFALRCALSDLWRALKRGEVP